MPLSEAKRMLDNGGYTPHRVNG